MKEFEDPADLPKDSVIGWNAAYRCAGRSKHYVMRHFYMGEFPKPWARVKITNAQGHKHWSNVWRLGDIKTCSATTSVVQ